MKLNSLLKSALAAIMVGSLTFTSAMAAAQSVSGQSRGGGNKQENRGRSNPPRTEQRQGNSQKRESQSRSEQNRGRVSEQNRQRSESQGRVSEQSRQRQEADKRKREAESRARQSRERQQEQSEARRRESQSKQRQEADRRARVNQNRQREDAEKRARATQNRQREEAAKRARASQNRQREEAEKRARAVQNRQRQEAQNRGRITDIQRGRSNDDRRAASVGRITQGRMTSESRAREIANQRWNEARRREDARRRDEENRRRQEEARRERERREYRDWNSYDHRVEFYDRPQTVSGIAGRTYERDDWYRPLQVTNIITRDWDRYEPRRKKSSPPWWSNSRHNRDLIYVAAPRTVYYDNDRDSDYDDWYYDDNPRDNVVFVQDDPWADDYGYSNWNSYDNDPYLTYNGYTSWQDAYDRRQEKKNEWRNIAYVSGALLVYGLLKDDDTLTFAGGAGTLYSIYRYEEDRKSQNKLKRLRAEYFSRDHFYRDGVRYDRRLVTKNGDKYYQFVRL